jgi:hypothetical protein
MCPICVAAGVQIAASAFSAVGLSAFGVKKLNAARAARELVPNRAAPPATAAGRHRGDR